MRCPLPLLSLLLLAFAALSICTQAGERRGGERGEERRAQTDSPAADADAALCAHCAAVCRCCIVTAAVSVGADGPSSHSAVELNQLGLSEAQRTDGPAPDLALAARHFASAARMGARAVRTLKRSRRAAAHDLLEAERDAHEAKQERDEGAGDEDDEEAEREAAAELEALRARLSQLDESLQSQRQLAADYRNNQAVTFMRLGDMTKSDDNNTADLSAATWAASVRAEQVCVQPNPK